MIGTETLRTSSGFDVVSSRVFDAPIEEVWKAWSDAEYVKQWWGPTGFTCRVAWMDFREGGSSVVCLHAPQSYGGGDMYDTWTYEVIEPYRRIEFVSRFSDADGVPVDPAAVGLPTGVPQSLRHLVEFEYRDGRTEMTVAIRRPQLAISHKPAWHSAWTRCLYSAADRSGRRHIHGRTG